MLQMFESHENVLCAACTAFDGTYWQKLLGLRYTYFLLSPKLNAQSGKQSFAFATKQYFNSDKSD